MKKIILLLIFLSATILSAKTGVVSGLDPNGDGFLSIRTKPKGTEIGRLYNGNKVKILKKSGKWYKIKTSSGKIGWSHGNWIRTKKTSSSKKYSTSRKVSDSYSIGSCVYMKGTMSLFLTVTIRGYVERKGSNNRIQIRISDTEGQTPYYKNQRLRPNSIMWDNKYSWTPC